jgi:hypothetical protein
MRSVVEDFRFDVMHSVARLSASERIAVSVRVPD